MGFFGKIKQNLQHGGVKVQLQAADTVSLQAASLPVTVIVSATDQPAQVNSVKAAITVQSFAKSPSSGKFGSTPDIGTSTVAAQAETNEPFSLSPGQSKTVQLSVVINPNQLPAASIGASTLGKLLDPSQYQYYVQATADVAGIAIDPAASQKLTIPEMGGFASHIQI